MSKSFTSIGPTEELSLRVSISTLSPVIFSRPEDGLTMIAMEKKATLEGNREARFVSISVQPFGGAVRIRNTTNLEQLIGEFLFDSVKSRDEQDSRFFIKPASWKRLKEYCLANLNHDTDLIFDSDPARELIEEFYDTIGIEPKPDQYQISHQKIVIEEGPVPTRNLRAPGEPTARIYRVDQVEILDRLLAERILENCISRTDQVLREIALGNYQAGGRGYANAMFTASLKGLRDFCQETHRSEKEAVVIYQGTTLAGNVPFVLDIPDQ